LDVESFLEADKGESDHGEIDELGGGDLNFGLVGRMGRIWNRWGSYQIDKPV
jgi:hypothetical protein